MLNCFAVSNFLSELTANLLELETCPEIKRARLRSAYDLYRPISILADVIASEPADDRSRAEPPFAAAF